MPRARSPLLGIGWDDCGCLLASIVPFAFAVARLPLDPEWRDDVPIVRGFGLSPGSFRGCLSTALTQLLALAPLGNRPFRGALVSALALAGCALAIYEIARRALADNADTPRLGPALACLAALSATLSGPFQLEGTIAGGAAVACLPLIASVLALQRFAPGDPRGPAIQGGLLAAALLESPAAALGILVVIAVHAYPRVGMAKSGSRALRLGLPALSFAATAGLLAAPTLLRGRRPLAIADAALLRAPLDLVSAADRAGELGPWLEQVGTLSLALGAVGFVLGFLRKRLRPHVKPLFAWALLDVACALATRLPAAKPFADDAIAVRLSGIAAFAIAASIGVQSLLAWLLRSPLAFARPAAVMLFMFDVTMVTTLAEQAAPSSDRSEARGATAWTDEAIMRLSPGTAMLLRSPGVIARLDAAAVSDGGRPDLLLIPVPLVGWGGVAADLLRAEPRVRDLLTQVSAFGSAGESALSSLAAARPIVAELDPGWDRRMLTHLVAESLWHRFAYEPRGPSDRRAAWSQFVPAVKRVRNAPSDEATARVLARAVEEQLAVAAALGDRDQAAELASLFDAVVPGSPRAAALKRRLGALRTEGGSNIDARTFLQ